MESDHQFHYQVDGGIIYLILAETSYPQKLAFMYLQDIVVSFQQELQNTYGTSVGVDYLSHIETIDSSYKFLKFERVINKKRKEFRDANAKENIDKLNQELVDVKSIMSESFEMLLNRDKNLNKLTEMGKSLTEDTKRMRRDAKNLKYKYFLRKNMTYIAIVGILLFLILLKIYVL